MAILLAKKGWWCRVKNKALLVVLLIALSIFSTQTLYSEANTAILEVSTDNIYLVVGQENSIAINLKNNGDYKLHDIEAFLTSTTPGLSVLQDAHKVYTEIGKEKTKTYEPILYVDQNLELGSYTLTLTIIYRRFGAIQDSTITVPIGLVLSEGYIPKIKYTSDQTDIKAQAGSENIVTYRFSNNWEETLYDLEFTLNSNSIYFSIVDGLSHSIKYMNVSEEILLQPTLSVLDGTPLTAYTITGIVTYRDEVGNRYHQVFSLPLIVDSAGSAENTIITIRNMDIIQGQVRPGDIFELQIGIKCSGAEAYDLLSSINFGSFGLISPLSPTVTSLGDLSEDETKTVAYSLLASGDITAGQHPVTITISYTDSKGLPKTFSETLTIMVDGLIEFELLDTAAPTYYSGEVGEAEADLLLIGTEGVQFVSIELIEDDKIDLVSGSEEYIGAVDPDSPIPFDISFKIQENADEGPHDMKLRINYRDHLNKEHSEELSLTVNIGSGQRPEENSSGRRGIIGWLLRLIGR
jgi:hypothetical protein